MTIHGGSPGERGYRMARMVANREWCESRMVPSMFHAQKNEAAPNISSKWMHADGTGFDLLYSCIPNGPYQFNPQRCTLKLKPK
jgi:hypothetical protein